MGLFSTPLPFGSSAYAGDATATLDDADTVNVTKGTATLDDAFWAGDGVPNQERGNVGDMVQSYRPPYAQEDFREIEASPGPDLPAQSFLAPAPGSTDLFEPRYAGSIPGTNSLNFMHGPVTGRALDEGFTGSRQGLESRPPGAYGPVVGGDDYSNIVSMATFQDSFANYSTAASDQTIVSAI